MGAMHVGERSPQNNAHPPPQNGAYHSPQNRAHPSPQNNAHPSPQNGEAHRWQHQAQAQPARAATPPPQLRREAWSDAAPPQPHPQKYAAQPQKFAAQLPPRRGPVGARASTDDAPRPVTPPRGMMNSDYQHDRAMTNAPAPQSARNACSAYTPPRAPDGVNSYLHPANPNNPDYSCRPVTPPGRQYPRHPNGPTENSSIGAWARSTSNYGVHPNNCNLAADPADHVRYEGNVIAEGAWPVQQGGYQRASSQAAKTFAQDANAFVSHQLAQTPPVREAQPR